NHFEMTITAKDLPFHLSNRIAAPLQVFRCGQITKTIFISLNLRNAAISIFKIMQGDQVLRPVCSDMVLDTDVIVKLIPFLQNKFSLPFYVKVGSLAECANSDFCFAMAPDGLQKKLFIFEFHLIDLRSFDHFNAVLLCDPSKHRVKFIPADTKSP